MLATPYSDRAVGRAGTHALHFRELSPRREDGGAAHHSTGQRKLGRGKELWVDHQTQGMPDLIRRSHFPKTSLKTYPKRKTVLSQVRGLDTEMPGIFFSEFITVFPLVMLQQKYKGTCAGIFIASLFHETNTWTRPNTYQQKR